MNEPLDRNKTDLTHRATATAAAWLDTIGCKPVETEVPVADGWVADAASFWCPTLTEARNARLLRPPIVPPDIQRDSLEALAHMYRSAGGRLTIVVEVKTSRADFLKDLGRKYGTYGDGVNKRAQLLPPAHLCVLATTPGVIGDKEWLLDWGQLLLSADGSRVTRWKGGWDINPQSPRQIENLLASVAIRRDHATRYARLRAWHKHYRAGAAS